MNIVDNEAQAKMEFIAPCRKIIMNQFHLSSSDRGESIKEPTSRSNLSYYKLKS